jgi:hypothetical protein
MSTCGATARKQSLVVAPNKVLGALMPFTQLQSVNNIRQYSGAA